MLLIDQIRRFPLGRRLIRRIRRHVPVPQRPAIIMYHRVADIPSDPWGLAVSPDNFAAQLDALKRDRTVLDMATFVDQAHAGTLPANAVAITFDDGYHDNLASAAPLLEAAGLPATLFLASGPSLLETGYWFEDLADLILDAPDAADIVLQVGEAPIEVRFGEREPLDDDRVGWRAWDGGRTERETIFHHLWDNIRVLTPEEQVETLERLGTALGRSPDRIARPMSASELRALAAGPFTLGGHTVDHVDLLELDDAAALDQMARGKADAERVTGAPIIGFAYPYGRTEPRLGPLVQAAGFKWACTTEHAHITPKEDDPFFLPRIQAEDEPGIDWLN